MDVSEPQNLFAIENLLLALKWFEILLILRAKLHTNTTWKLRNIIDDYHRPNDDDQHSGPNWNHHSNGRPKNYI